MLNQEDYQRNGFFIINNFLSNEECDALMAQAKKLIHEFDENETKTIFSTLSPQHERDDYFLSSGDKIRFFFEEKALNMHGEFTTDKLLSINKIGHALHDLDPVFNKISYSTKISALANQLNIHDPAIVQSMYICKQPRIGGEVNCHQDATYLHVKEQPITGLWFALEDATLENGCLWAIPGAHQTPLKSKMFRDAQDKITNKIYDHTPWPLDKMIPLEVPRGSVIVLHGLLPHMSKTNLSAKSRHAYTLHLMSRKHEFESTNWLKPSSNGFRKFDSFN